MNFNYRMIPIAFIFILVLNVANCSEKTVVGDGLIFDQAVIRPIPETNITTSGYISITNHGEPDRLVSANVDWAEACEIHSMKEEAGMMKMRKVDEGFPIASHSSLILKPGGNHLMFINLKRKIKLGDSLKVRLNFEKMGTKEIDFQVADPNSMDSQTGSESHEGHKH
ncbi:copper chaperone PCu(A)C [Leptospira sp. GIMC2001]|uniref:copper chaperone PCu(A)C n=1 Tax=Leptospira sp. GIMC2001 TaxID=1513297 RepID=UPI0023493A0D|nr:copper chaperone PCu(A)C [Leptospira sp. GIMC2001]WCL48948.1 copper chaperone PCu(A)C [Leptospira sp. GIMC2001]